MDFEEEVAREVERALNACPMGCDHLETTDRIAAMRTPGGWIVYLDWPGAPIYMLTLEKMPELMIFHEKPSTGFWKRFMRRARQYERRPAAAAGGA